MGFWFNYPKGIAIEYTPTSDEVINSFVCNIKKVDSTNSRTYRGVIWKRQDNLINENGLVSDSYISNGLGTNTIEVSNSEYQMKTFNFDKTRLFAGTTYYIGIYDINYTTKNTNKYPKLNVNYSADGKNIYYLGVTAAQSDFYKLNGIYDTTDSKCDVAVSTNAISNATLTITSSIAVSENSNNYNIVVSANASCSNWQYKINNGEWSTSIDTAGTSHTFSSITLSEGYNYVYVRAKSSSYIYNNVNEYTNNAVAVIDNRGLTLALSKSDNFTVIPSPLSITTDITCTTNITCSNNIQYRYRAENDSNWTTWTHATLSNNKFTLILPSYNKYILEVKAVSASNSKKTITTLLLVDARRQSISFVTKNTKVINSTTAQFQIQSDLDIGMQLMYYTVNGGATLQRIFTGTNDDIITLSGLAGSVVSISVYTVQQGITSEIAYKTLNLTQPMITASVKQITSTSFKILLDVTNTTVMPLSWYYSLNSGPDVLIPSGPDMFPYITFEIASLTAETTYVITGKVILDDEYGVRSSNTLTIKTLPPDNPACKLATPYIYNNGTWTPAISYICENSVFRRYTPYIYQTDN